MNSSTNTMVAGLAGVAAGIAVGLFLSSRRGVEMRTRIADSIREGSRLVEQQLRGIERQLHDLDHVIRESKQGFVDRLARVGRADDAPQTGQEWGLSPKEVVSELPRLPRR
ncbi:MAG TPA: YtxH domain-containing protein [Rhodothermales bacterium]